jgi:hypothetical protein
MIFSRGAERVDPRTMSVPVRQRAPSRGRRADDYYRPRPEPDEAPLTPEDAEEELQGIPWRSIVLLLSVIFTLVSFDITLCFVVARLVTGHAY